MRFGVAVRVVSSTAMQPDYMSAKDRGLHSLLWQVSLVVGDARDVQYKHYDHLSSNVLDTINELDFFRRRRHSLT